MSSSSYKKYLVTGGAGFIGSHLVEDLVARGHEVKVLDNFVTGKRENLLQLGDGRFLPNRDFELIEGDIRDYQTLLTTTARLDGIFHQAALGSVPRSVGDPLTTQDVNANGTLNVLWAAHKNGVQRVVFASSSSVYGSSVTLPKREGSEGLPLSPYALTKKINEEHSKLFKDLYGLDTIGLRYFNVYGPRQDPNSEYAAVIPRFVTRLLAGVSPIIYGTGLQSRDFTFVKDVVKANLMSMEAPTEVCGASYNVGRGDQINLLELLDNLKDLLGKRIDPVFEPTRPGDVMHSSADISLAREKLGFQAKWELRNGLEASIGYYAGTSASK
ncbi:MAG: NAD-dependent epimerase/dehydratase family protein [Deltaproteobacteria bacterium]|nr:NAD-dependent epimerase/dehydratase family protein [Deltaproteobacteria bacterium]